VLIILRGVGGWRSRVPTSVFRILLVIALAIVISPVCLAQENVSLASQKIDMYMAYNKVLVESIMVFSSPSTTNLSIELPVDARQITDDADSISSPTILEENLLLFFLDRAKKIDYSYITSELLDGESFVASFNAPLDTSLLRIRLSLPEKATLDKPLRKGAVLGSSVYPTPKRLETDGQVITVVWEFSDVKQGDEVALYAKYKKPFRYSLPLILIMLGVAIIVFSAAYLAHRSRVNKALNARPAKDAPSSGIEQHLKEDEEQIINLLKMKEGSCEQGTLLVATNFSKAMLSAIPKELETRKIVRKEKRGKKNLVFLK
jgi:uncharacterized membrane protein